MKHQFELLVAFCFLLTRHIFRGGYFSVGVVSFSAQELIGSDAENLCD